MREKRKKITAAIQSDDAKYLPQEIVVEILKRLPVKSILKSMSVCKLWHSLITDPEFIATHLNHQAIAKNDFMLLRYNCLIHKCDYVSIRRDDESFSEYFELKFPLEHKSLRVYGCCNGLVCVSNYYLLLGSAVYLWNPGIRKLKALPPSLIRSDSSEHEYNSSVYLAFGFLPMIDDYRVVRIVDTNEGKPLGVEVYSLRTDSWRRIVGPVVVPSCYIFGRPAVMINELAHWVAYKRTEEGNLYFVLCFDLKDEVFHEITVPDNIRPNHTILIAGLGELLYLFQLDLSAGYEGCNIYVLEWRAMGCWIKLYTNDLHFVIGTLFIGQLGLRKNREVLFVKGYGDLVSYNLETRQVKELGISGWSSVFCSYPYMESLLLFDGRSPLSLLVNCGDEGSKDDSTQEADGGVNKVKIRNKVKVRNLKARKERRKR